MMNIHRIVLLAFLQIFFWGKGQHSMDNEKQLDQFKSIQQETVFIHLNNEILMVGEKLYYKIYVLNAKNLKPSDLSKIAYVQLIDKNGVTIFKHKLKITEGIGQGDFFVPTTIPTDSYKLVGFTHWMFNGSQENFFSTDVNIINPYQKLPPSARNGMASNLDSLHGKNKYPELPKAKENSKVDIVLHKRAFGKREKVRLTLKKFDDAPPSGNYSISIRKKNFLNTSNNNASIEVNSPIPVGENYNKKLGDLIYLPELRGELISGRVVSIKDNIALAQEDLSLSVLGYSDIIRISKTNASGQFYFSLNRPAFSNKIAFQLIDDPDEDHKIILDEHPSLNADLFTFNTLHIPKRFNDKINQRAVFNQIEHAYLKFKGDSTLREKPGPEILAELEENYILDEFNRFKSLQETVIEIIEDVFLREKDGVYRFEVRRPNSYFINPNDTPLVVVDGVLALNLDKIINFDVKKIMEIGISRHEYFIGPRRYQGIVAIKTENQEYLSEITGQEIEPIDFNSIFPKKKYFAQDYGGDLYSKAKNIPDFRNQLLWKTDLDLKANETHLEFYTSDNTGEYIIDLAGWSASGQSVRVFETFSVE